MNSLAGDDFESLAQRLTQANFVLLGVGGMRVSTPFSVGDGLRAPAWRGAFCA